MGDSPFRLPEPICNDSSLPSLPSVAIEVLRLMEDPDAEIDDLVSAISSDPAMSVKILKLANTPQYRRDREVTSLPQAATVLGLKTIKLLALSFSLASSLPRNGKTDSFDFGEYWRRSLTTAVTAQALARAVREPYGDEAFLAGLLMRIGQLAMATTISDEYTAVIERCESLLPTAGVEHELLGFDHHQVGGALLASWGVPQLLSQSVERWPLQGASSGESDEKALKTMCRILQISDAVAILSCEEADRGRVLAQIHKLALSQFGLAEEEVDDFVVNLQDKVDATASALDIHVAEPHDFEAIMRVARQQMLQVSLDTVADLSQAESRANDLDVSSKTDKLTGVPNRAHFDLRLRDVIDARLKNQSDKALGVLVIDVDHFKSFNDRFGHVVGDKVLKSVASWLSETTRGTDFTARYGGEEFVVILPNTTLPDLESAAERLRRAVEGNVVDSSGEILSVTISIGGACVNRVTSANDGMALVELADQCLYAAKDAGRNQCVCREVQLVQA